MIIKFIVIKFKLGCKILIAYFRWNIITKVLLQKIAIVNEIIELFQKLSNSSVLQGINIIKIERLFKVQKINRIDFFLSNFPFPQFEDLSFVYLFLN